MATRSYIAMKVGENAYKGVYCHYDGYLDYNGLMIREEKSDMSWAHDAFDEDGNVLDGYDFDECPPDTRLETYAYWTITNNSNWQMRDCIALVRLEVK